MKAHFIGICGAGMSAVAKLLKESGWEISGSDEGFYPPISLYLEANNLPCTSYYAAANIPEDADVIVIGKHAKLVPEENEEVAAALKSGIPVKSFPEILNDLTDNCYNFVVAGSFAKSTCATLTSWILSHTGKDPSYFIGAIPIDLPSNAHIGTSDTFVLEGDEYPSANWDTNAKFLYYNAHTVLLTSCEHDHVNVFPTVGAYLEPFVQLIMQLPPDGMVVACLDGENVETVLAKAGRSAILYSLNNTAADWWAQDITHSATATHFTLYFRGTAITQLETVLLGDHNIQNIVGASAWLLSNDMVSVEQLQAAVREFHGVKRRMELRIRNTTVPVYEDFGSSHAKATAGLKTIRTQYPERRMIVLFEPHTFSFRNREALSWYNDLFHEADIIFVYQPPTHGAASHAQLTQEEIASAIKATGKQVFTPQSKDDLLDTLKPLVQPNDVILIETSGDLGGAIEPVVDLINERFANPSSSLEAH